VPSITTHSAVDVVIIGDGIIGLSTALELGRAGARCRVIGARNSGVGSFAAAGLLAPDIAHLPKAAAPFYLASLALYPLFVERLSAFDSDLSLVRGLLELPDNAVRDGRHLSTAEVAALEPQLAAPHGAILRASDGAVDNVRLTLALRAAVEANPGISVSYDDAAERVELSVARAGVVTRSGERVEAARVILAAGPWASRIDGLPRPIPVEPLKGQMIAFGGTLLRHAAMASDVYLVPRGNETLAGATVEHAGFDTQTTATAIEALRAAAARACPALASTGVTRAWAGIRPATPDLLPILGHDRDAPRLLYACGHSKNGILLAPATAVAVTQLALGNTPDWDLAAFDIRRFGANKVPD
jgi:glycine/D-amino acid oxidase-like deaminating enzyme